MNPRPMCGCQLLFLSIVSALVPEDSDATCTFEVKCGEANAVVRRSARRDVRSNLHDGKNVIVLGQCGGVLTSDVRHILELFTGLRIDDAK